MSPRNAEIVIVEDDVNYARTSKSALEKGGHKVLIILSSLAQLAQFLTSGIKFSPKIGFDYIRY